MAKGGLMPLFLPSLFGGANNVGTSRMLYLGQLGAATHFKPECRN